MLLLHQAGSVKIGEVVRYTVTYTPANDRILPSPSTLHLKIKNTTAIALRAAFVHGPYTIYAAAYPATFNPNRKFENPRRDGVPEFEPNLKAGGSFSTALVVPEEVRASAGSADRHGQRPGREEEAKSVSWIIEVSSQVIFSNSASVNFEVLLGRDEKSLNLGFANPLGGATTAPVPGQVSDHQQSRGAKDGHHGAQPRGIFSKAIKLTVDDTASLWNTPRMPEWDDAEKERPEIDNKDEAMESVTKPKEDMDDGHRPKRQKKIHLVVLTHGLHSNLGADMLFLKESIDATAEQAKKDAKARRAKRHKESKDASVLGKSREQHNDNERKGEDGSIKPPAEQLEDDTDVDDDEEEIIVRGFSGNAVRTERGIKYLGKRLAKYVLAMTYPDQPFKPVTKKSAGEALTHALKPELSRTNDDGTQARHKSGIEKATYQGKKLPYKITSISFIAHSLGGLIQTYAVAYIQKHSPEFFDIIQPINFIALASPFLGLSNENPLYVKFALDFGLVGRTGKDLGLTWRAPTIARSGWGAIVGGIGESASKKLEGNVAPESKPLLRILPTGPAHAVLKRFRNRTVYSNVVNDGIVPLRTSCLLFLDWSGLGRVEKARRENGLVGTIAGWGWAEVTGQNSSSPMRQTLSDTGSSDAEETGNNTPTRQGHGEDVPQPPPDATDNDDTRSMRSLKNGHRRSADLPSSGSDAPTSVSTSASADGSSPFASLVNFFKPNPTPKPHNDHPKHTKIYKRSQTIHFGSNTSIPSISKQEPTPARGRSKVTTGDSEREDFDRMSAPPKTTFFESAGDLLKPPLPSVQFLVDPASRPRTIFHDRVYHPEDIPPPPLKKRATSSLLRRRSSQGSKDTMSPPSVKHAESSLSSRDYDDTKHTNPDKDPRDVVDGSAMKVEEKIARAYHRDLSWRKVLVRLEPDAHNNMIVRRMFANAYGWPVVKHLCDTHFSDAAVATTRDEDEGSEERAKSTDEAPDADGSEMKDKGDGPVNMLGDAGRTDSESREAKDSVPALSSASKPGSLGLALAGRGMNVRNLSYESEAWSERDWADSEVDSEEEDATQGKRNSAEGKKAGWNWTEAIAGKGATSPKGTDKADIDKFLGKRHDGADDKILESDAAAAKVTAGEAAGMGDGLSQLSIDE
ncbi:Revertant of glycogen synthase kinase mutation 1 [Hyphodiscus hymeniophilus]|uniref:Revertant of glycogen synthase kinase mutation 1 n=1 Tax=Hyphodiscus hymeniophilus TaxID=353542 RepID=A0A9P6VM68_9HELO|nr:Revertant of glycogen synthase kinase mutation 1 [Hyphodiscus hymeniophilus]